MKKKRLMLELRLCVFVLAAAACGGDPELGTIDQNACNCDIDPIPCCCTTPIVIDVAGDGIRLTSWENGVVFELRPGRPSDRAWTEPDSDDAWLVLDRNEDGLINDGAEMFGDVTEQPSPPDGAAKNGFLALAQFDDNADRVVDDGDAIFARLHLWQDTNHDGVSQVAEVRPLSDVGVTGISLDYVETRQPDAHKNVFRYRAQVYAAVGSPVGMTAWDVLLTSGSKPRSTEREQQPLLPRLWACTCYCTIPETPPVLGTPCRNPSRTDGRWRGAASSTVSESSARFYCRGDARVNADDGGVPLQACGYAAPTDCSYTCGTPEC